MEHEGGGSGAVVDLGLPSTGADEINAITDRREPMPDEIVVVLLL
jgi:hypothetical protein